MERPFDADHQQLGVEDEQKRQDGGADAVDEALYARLDGIAARDGRRRIGRQPHRWRDVGEDAEIEHKQMHRHQGHDQARLRPQGDDDRRHQRGHYDVVGRGRQPHAQEQTDAGGEQQHQNQVAPGDEFHELRHHQPHAGEGHGADDDARRRGGDADADHIAGAQR